MVLFHAVYDLVFIAGVIPSNLFFTTPVNIWRASISWTFLLIAGAMCTFSRSNYRRAGIYLIVALGIYRVTSLIDASVEISYGIIYCMGFCTLFAACLSSLGFSPQGYAWAAAFFIAFLLALSVPNGAISLFGIQIARIPRAIYHTGLFSWLGFPGPDFISADYYPPIPYFFLYLAGWSLGLTWKREGYTHPLWRFSIAPLEAVGRYALPIYVLHQPVLLLVAHVISIAIGR